MKILRSEAVDKSPGVFFDPEQHFKGPGTPGAIKQAKKTIFQKIPKFPKIAKNGVMVMVVMMMLLLMLMVMMMMPRHVGHVI